MKTCLLVIDAQESFRHRPFFTEQDLPAYLAAQNALIAPAVKLCPEITEKIQQLYGLGAAYAQMSGSGSTVYGVHPSEGEARNAAGMLGKNAIVTETLHQ